MKNNFNFQNWHERYYVVCFKTMFYLINTFLLLSYVIYYSIQEYQNRIIEHKQNIKCNTNTALHPFSFGV